MIDFFTFRSETQPSNFLSNTNSFLSLNGEKLAKHARGNNTLLDCGQANLRQVKSAEDISLCCGACSYLVYSMCCVTLVAKRFIPTKTRTLIRLICLMFHRLIGVSHPIRVDTRMYRMFDVRFVIFQQNLYSARFSSSQMRQPIERKSVGVLPLRDSIPLRSIRGGGNGGGIRHSYLGAGGSDGDTGRRIVVNAFRTPVGSSENFIASLYVISYAVRNVAPTCFENLRVLLVFLVVK